jgi:Beta-L-arabinofuranosidase, GH127 catalytic domain/Beta-L-arabinofuranosidase, GH127 middle domain
MKLTALMILVFNICSFFVMAGRGEENMTAQISLVRTPPATASNKLYVSNRPPLVPSPLVKLPIGNLEPKGWLLSQLQLMRNGFSGRLQEISKFLKDDSGWITLQGRGWEEMPYWLKGYADLGYILKDPKIIAEAKKWLGLAFRSQQEDGYFGPRENKKNHDLWPNMLVLTAMQSLYEAAGDERVVPFLTRYFRFEYNLPPADLLPESWQKLRGGENLESVYWLYNRTGERFLLELGRRLYEKTADWETDIINPERDRNWEVSSFYHGVNISMGIRYPGVFYQQAGDRKYIDIVEKNYRLLMGKYGQGPGGMFGADENIRPGYVDPRQAAETCSIVEFMNSDEALLKITGETRYADRCEEIAFNTLPASMTPDLKGLHYLTAPNLISCDRSGEHDFQNDGTLVSYDPWSYRCCQHNVAFGWPYFAEHLWLATSDNGLAAALYAPSEVRAKVADGADIRISEDTSYPFGDIIDFTVWLDAPVSFPLYLRIPAWSKGTKIRINGEEQRAELIPGHYAVITREWQNGDQVRVAFSPTIVVEKWEKIGNAASVRRGPLWFSLKIGEEWKRYGGTEAWPAYEVLPSTPWNYGLVVEASQPEASISLMSQKEPAHQPFEPDAAPVVLQARASRIPEWKAEGKMVGKIPPGPAVSSEPVEVITLIPMGCARLRLSVFPLLKPSD